MIDRIFQILFFGAAAFLLMVFGAALLYFNIPPGSLMRKAFEGGAAVAELYKFVGEEDKFQTHLWGSAPDSSGGVTTYDQAGALNGYTLYASTHKQAAQLIDMNGNVVHEWTADFHDVFDGTSHIKNRVSPENIYWRKLFLYPNGDLLVTLSAAQATPWGYGLMKLDKDSNPLWIYPAAVHHDVDVAPDGRIVVPVHWIANDAPDGLGHLTPPLIEDGIAILSADGKEQKRISITKSFLKSPYAAWLDLVSDKPKGDITHNNNAEWSPDGDVLISLREADLIAVINPSIEQVTWAMRGPWKAQHDPDFLPDGTLLLFDNQGGHHKNGPTRLLEVDPLTQKITWIYAGFDNAIRGNQHRLRNNNTLITDSQNGRIFEITRAGDIVWEFINPARGGGGKFIAVICGAMRYTKEELSFLKGKM